MQRSRWKSQAPPRQPLLTILIATVTTTAALAAIAALGIISNHLLLIPPMAGSMALIAGAPSLPLAQPRNVVFGQILSALVGVSIGFFGNNLWTAAIAGGVSLGAMMLFRISHSPGAATAVIGAFLVSGRVTFVVCVALATVVLVLFGVIRAMLKRTPYPTYWW